MTLRDQWVGFWHALPPFRGRLAIARIVGEHLLTTRRNAVAWATLPNGYRVKLDLRWRGGYDGLYYFRTYEAPLTNLIRQALDIDGACFIDVGANIGVFTFLAADVMRARRGRALAVEPLPMNLAFLRESITANGLDDLVEVAAVAVGNCEGALRLEVMAPGEIANARPTTWAGDESSDAKVVEVPMTTLDRLAREWTKVQFVKIDVEGAEMFVLRGATELLKRERPLVYCEFHREFMAANGTKFSEIESFARAYDYTIRYLGQTGRVTACPPSPESRFLDIILVPHEPTAHQRALMEPG